MTTATAIHALTREYKDLQREPVEGCQLELVNDANVLKWQVSIFGPPDTIFQGGYFKACLTFPPSYPYQPPIFQFLTKVWHPNVYLTGYLCISILEPIIAGNPMSAELLSERWNPARNVRTILLSVISLLSDPNTHSAVNGTAAMMFNLWKEGLDDEYEKIVRELVQKSQAVAEEERTALHYATIKNEDSEVLQLILDSNIEIDKRCDAGMTALHYASKEYRLERMHQLVARGADVNIKDHCESTPLCLFISEPSSAARMNEAQITEAVKLLLEK